MKFPQIVLCSIALLLPLAQAAKAGEAQQFLTEAQAAYMKGDMETAKTNFEWVLKLDPHNRTAIGYLRMIEAQNAQNNKGVALEKQLSGLTIAKLDFKEATLGSALDYMKKAADKLSNGKVAVSFVVLLSPEQVNAQTITLNLSNVPYTEALKYIGDLAALKFTYEKYAIKVTPRSTEGASASAGGTPPAGPATK